jgi:nitrogen fixation protein FixH
VSEANMKPNSNSNSESKKLGWYKSPWVIGWLLLVLVVLAVNAFMIFQSVNDYPGLVVDDFYERGQDYEENILAKLENNQKWTPEFDFQELHLDKAGIIKITLKDSSGKLAPIEKMTLFAYRPADAKQDFSAPMTLSDDKTHYWVKVTFNRKGYWDLLAGAVVEDSEVNYAKRIFVKD